MWQWKMLRGAMTVVCAIAFNGLSQAAPPESPGRDYYLYLSKLPLAAKNGLRGTPGKDLDFYCAGSETDAQSFGRIAPTAPTQEPPQLLGCRDRLLDGKDATVTVVYVALVEGTTCPAETEVTLVPDEEARRTAAAEGAQAIRKFVEQKLAAAAPAAKAAASAPPRTPQVYCYWQASTVLHQVRARLSLKVTLPPLAVSAASSGAAPTPAAAPSAVAKGATAQPTPQPTSADGQPETATIALVTGPTEHVFFSGDAIVRGAKELKYDPTTKGVFERDKPDQLYLGLNFMVGDVYGHYDWDSPRRLLAKVLITPTKHPFDSVGLGVGYRFKDLSDMLDSTGSTSGPQASGGFVLFVGHFWTKGDSADNDGGASNGKRTQSWRVGVSYSLDTLFGWLK